MKRVSLWPLDHTERIVDNDIEAGRVNIVITWIVVQDSKVGPSWNTYDL